MSFPNGSDTLDHFHLVLDNDHSPFYWLIMNENIKSILIALDRKIFAGRQILYQVNLQTNPLVMNPENETNLSNEAKTFIKNVQKHNFIRLSFTDLNGMHLSKLLPTRFAKKIAEGKCEMYSGIITFGPRFEVTNIPEIVKKKYVNNLLKPDFSTLHTCQWITQKNDVQTQKDPKLSGNPERTDGKYTVCSVLCDLAWPNNEAMNVYPRVVAQKLIKQLEDKYKVRLFSAFEPEFRAFVKGSSEKSFLKPKSLNLLQGTVSEPIPCTKYNDMYKTSLLSFYEDFFADVDYNLQIAKIDVQDYSNEDGDGQLECPLMPTWGLSAADNYFIFKQAVKEIGSKHEMEISFMTKPLLNASSSGCHYNHSLWYADSNRNAFFDEKDPDGLSLLARHWIGGLIEHLPAMLAICSPTVNCYRRLNKFYAPGPINWDFRDRFVAVRVKNFGESNTYIENRIPSSASCPYHVLAATLAAGLDGLDRQLEPPTPGQKPLVGEIGVHVKMLPSTLQEAVKNLKEDDIFAKKLGTDFCKWYICMKECGDLGYLGHLDTNDNREETLAFERYEYLKFS
ncbi:unnamed protein product [Heterobilharzia americana]|nr:unnamed protein product [Heterobilharzia americana]